MHIPKKFEQNNLNELTGLIKAYPLALLVTDTPFGLEANHIPFIFEPTHEQNLLQGHIAKVNPICNYMSDSSEVLLVFNGPNCYISPNHYPTKKLTGKVVPTWNYTTVHVMGQISFIHDEVWKLNHLNQLTDQQESQYKTPWSVSDAPDEYIKKMLPAIVGIEVLVSTMNGQWKVSQNQPKINQQGVITGLSQEANSDSSKMVELVKNTLNKSQ